MNRQPISSPTRQSLPVAVVLGRRVVRRSFWSVPAWRLTAVLVGDGVAGDDAAGRRLRQDDDGAETLFRWSGLAVSLYRDAAERYWQGLVGQEPKVHVLCRARGGEIDESEPEIEPIRVTIDYDEALAWGDMDQKVLSAPIPGELYRAMEAFVLDHYRPKPFEKRRRRNWRGDDDRRPGATTDGAGGA